jgi:3-dehydroquinate synthase
MVMAADLSERHQWVDPSVKQRTIALLEQSSLPIKSPSEMTPDRYMRAMAIDKKTIDGTIKLVLLKNLGEAFVTADYDPELLQQTLESS